jgi:hypothetical protein
MYKRFFDEIIVEITGKVESALFRDYLYNSASSSGTKHKRIIKRPINKIIAENNVEFDKLLRSGTDMVAIVPSAEPLITTVASILKSIAVTGNE